MKTLVNLFLAFFKVGIITFGGGLSMLPMLERIIVKEKNWATQEELIDYYAVGQCTPGIIAVNTATFIGYKQKGILGAVAATFGMITPSLIIIVIIASFIKNFANMEIVQHIFSGIRITVAALVTDSVIKLWKSGIKDLFGILLFLVVFAVSVVFKLSPIYIVIASIILGIFYSVIKHKKF